MVHKLNQKGDTIIEVLIAIAIVSGVLGMSYSVMNRNLAVVVDNQERTTASKMLQSEVEQLRIVSLKDLNSIKSAADSGSFCLGESGDIYHVGNVESLDTDNYADECILGTYYKSITKNSSDGFTLRVGWNSPNGAQSSIMIGYRVN